MWGRSKKQVLRKRSNRPRLISQLNMELRNFVWIGCKTNILRYKSIIPNQFVLFTNIKTTTCFHWNIVKILKTSRIAVGVNTYIFTIQIYVSRGFLYINDGKQNIYYFRGRRRIRGISQWTADGVIVRGRRGLYVVVSMLCSAMLTV